MYASSEVFSFWPRNAGAARIATSSAPALRRLAIRLAEPNWGSRSIPVCGVDRLIPHLQWLPTQPTRKEKFRLRVAFGACQKDLIPSDFQGISAAEETRRALSRYRRSRLYRFEHCRGTRPPRAGRRGARRSLVR